MVPAMGREAGEARMLGRIGIGAVAALLALAPVGTPAPGEAVPARAHAQRALLERLLAQASPIPLVDIANQRAVAQGLIERGLARLVRVDVLRRPAGPTVGGCSGRRVS